MTLKEIKVGDNILQEAINGKCFDCTYGKKLEITYCTEEHCALWPHRPFQRKANVTVRKAPSPNSGYEGEWKAPSGISHDDLIERIEDALPDGNYNIELFDHMGMQMRKKARCFHQSGSYIA